jgi:hypothetical protein
MDGWDWLWMTFGMGFWIVLIGVVVYFAVRYYAPTGRPGRSRPTTRLAREPDAFALARVVELLLANDVRRLRGPAVAHRPSPTLAPARCADPRPPCLSADGGPLDTFVGKTGTRAALKAARITIWRPRRRGVVSFDVRGPGGSASYLVRLCFPRG